MHYNSVLVHLALIKGIGPVSIKTIIQQIGPTNLHEIYTLTLSDFINRCGLSRAISSLIVQGLLQKELLENEQDLIAKHEIHTITILDSGYPALLKEIYVPPIVLYGMGDVSLLSNKSIAVIGSRQAGQYAQRVIDAWVPLLIQTGWVIVSGGALGADAMAHQAGPEGSR